VRRAQAKARPKVAIAVGPEAAPVLAALEQLHHNIGSVDAAKVHADAPAGARLLCVNLVDQLAIGELGADLRRELDGLPAALRATDRVLVMPLPLGTILVVFLDIAALDIGP
jgi:hypothetical protein